MPFPLPLSASVDRRPVAVIGAGPVGLSLAAGLARQGIPCLVLEQRGAPAPGSRAICLSRRTLEIWPHTGIVDEVLARGLPWSGGSSFWRGHEVLRFAMPGQPGQRHPPMLNLQQDVTEACLVRALAARAPGVELRWNTHVAAIEPGPEGVTLTLELAEGAEERLEVEWLVAADGARSPTRAALGLRLEGDSYEGRYLIADIRLRSDAPVERRAWFDPPSNPGSTVLMHRQPEDVWRIDYQLREDEDAEAEQDPARIRARIDAHLAMIGETGGYELLWSSLYRAHCLTLPAYRQGRVLLAGDAAHLVPIFGVRGLNSGVDDAANLAWKLAAVLRGRASPRLLDSYSEERVFAARENIRQARKSTLFMTPPSRGFALMRDAALSLAVGQGFARALADPRQTMAITYPVDGPVDDPMGGLQSPEQGRWSAGPEVGACLPDLPLAPGEAPGAPTGATHLLDLLGQAPLLLVAGAKAGAAAALAGSAAGLDLALLDPRGAVVAELGLEGPGSGYLVRPDGHVAFRWQGEPEPTALGSALARLRGEGGGEA